MLLRLCSLTLACMLLLTVTLRAARADEPPRPVARTEPMGQPKLRIDESLPDLDVVLHPELYTDFEPPPPPRVQRWYGRTLMLADAASLGLFVTGLNTDSSRLTEIGVAGMLLTSPIVHAFHGHLDRGLVGVLMRWGAGSLAGYAVYAVTHSRMAGYTGDIVAYLAVVTFDGMYFCKDWVPNAAYDIPERDAGPGVKLQANGATLGFGGSF